MMKSVIDNGTDKNVYAAGYSIGDKTGTSIKFAESANGKTKYIYPSQQLSHLTIQKK